MTYNTLPNLPPVNYQVAVLFLDIGSEPIREPIPSEPIRAHKTESLYSLSVRKLKELNENISGWNTLQKKMSRIHSPCCEEYISSG